MTTPVYRERRRREKLRRRARDRDLTRLRAGAKQRRWTASPKQREEVGAAVAAWWSTSEGRAAWTAADIERKLGRRLAKVRADVAALKVRIVANSATIAGMQCAANEPRER